MILHLNYSRLIFGSSIFSNSSAINNQLLYIMPIIGIDLLVVDVSIHHLCVRVEGRILIPEALVAIVVGHAEAMLHLVYLHSVIQRPFLQLCTPIHLHVLIAEVAVENRVRSLHGRKSFYGDLY